MSRLIVTIFGVAASLLIAFQLLGPMFLLDYKCSGEWSVHSSRPECASATFWSYVAVGVVALTMLSFFTAIVRAIWTRTLTWSAR